VSASSLAIQNSVQLYGGQSLPDIGSGDVAQLQASAQAYLDNNTTTAANDGRISNGAAAAASIIQNGYNPDNASDNQALVTTIAGGCSLIPGVGPILGAIIIGMYEIGTQVIAPLVDKLLGYSSTPTCSSSGNWTTAGVLANCGITSFPPAGTLAGLVVPALGKAYAQQMNCDAFNKVPGTIPYGFQMTVGPLLKMWNQTTGGDLIDYFVPRMTTYDWPGGGGGGNIFTGNIDCAAGPFCSAVLAPYAFLPISEVPEWGANNLHILDPFTEGSEWIRLAANAGPLRLAATTPRIVSLHLMPLSPNAPIMSVGPASAVAAPGMSTGGKVALSVAVVGAAAAGGVGIWAFMTHQAYGEAWSRVWKRSTGKLLRKG
jgi:hypothetical protein